MSVETKANFPNLVSVRGMKKLGKSLSDKKFKDCFYLDKDGQRAIYEPIRVEDGEISHYALRSVVAVPE